MSDENGEREEEAGGRGPRARRAHGDRGDLSSARRVRRRREHLRPRRLREGRVGPRGVVGELGREARVDRAVGRGPRLVGPAAREVVRGRQAERLRQLPRPPRRRRQRRPRRFLLGGRGRRRLRAAAGAQGDHLRVAPRPGPALRERPQGPRDRQGRRRRHLHADGARGRCRDARLRADRRDPQRRLRRLLARVGPRAHGGLRGEGARHGRRDASPRRAAPDEGEGRRHRREARLARAHHRPRPLRDRPAHDRGPRRLLAGGGGGRRPRVRARADGRRGPALHPLHVGLDRKAEGHPPHDRRLPHAGERHAQDGLRPEGRVGRVLVRRRHRLGHRPHLHRLRPARERRDVRHVRGRAQLPGRGPLVVDHRALRSLDLLHRADGDPRLHEVGHGAPGEARSLARSACSARSASRSTRARGSGTTSTSAARTARSSTPGGRPRRAGS